MKYTKYFGLISRHQGQLNLPPSEFQRMMNIVHLTGLTFATAEKILFALDSKMEFEKYPTYVPDLHRKYSTY